MANQYVNKVVVNGVTKIDLTEDTVNSNTLSIGHTAHSSSGQIIEGAAVLSPYISGLSGMFRGIQLGSGSSFDEAATNAQKNAIASGSFENLFIGDYWVINNTIYRIADINYWMHVTDSDTDFTTNHLVIVPDTYLATGVMNSTETSNGGYIGSYLRSNSNGALATAKNKINTDFGNYLLMHRALLSSNTITDNNIDSQVSWTNSDVELMNSVMVFGYDIRRRFFNGIDTNRTDAIKQLALFRLKPTFINKNRYSYWLRDIVSNTEFAYIETSGIEAYSSANVSNNVRPVFAITCSSPSGGSYTPSEDSVYVVDLIERMLMSDKIIYDISDKILSDYPTAEEVQSAAEEARSAAEEANSAIEAIEDISELAIPEMTTEIRGGAKLGDGLVLTDGALGIDPEPQESTGKVRGAITSLTAKGHAEQTSTTGKNLLKPRPSPATSVNGVTYTANDDGSIRIQGTATSNADWTISNIDANQIVVASGDYAFSANGLVSGVKLIVSGNEYNGFPYKEMTNSLPSASAAVSDASKPFRYIVVRVVSGTTVDTTIYPQLELGSTATDYEPYTGGLPSPSPDYPQDIQVARGRNLLKPTSTASREGITWTVNDLGQTVVNGTPTANIPSIVFMNGETLKAGTYTMSNQSSEQSTLRINDITSGTATNIGSVNNGKTMTFTLSSDTTIQCRYFVYQSHGAYSNFVIMAQLEAGSTPTTYVPYGHVGLEVTHGGMTTTIHVPLPSKGFAASLPDGTADVLTIDGAGKVEWESATWMDAIDGSTLKCQSVSTTSGVAWINLSHSISPNDYRVMDESTLCDKLMRNTRAAVAVGTQGIAAADNARCFVCVTDMDTTSKATVDTWLQSNPLTVLYQLASPITEDCGYIDWPDIPEDTTISCPELNDLGMHYIIGNDAKKMAMEWYKRAKYELENRVSDLEQAVSDLVTS